MGYVAVGVGPGTPQLLAQVANKPKGSGLIEDTPQDSLRILGAQQGTSVPGAAFGARPSPPGGGLLNGALDALKNLLGQGGGAAVAPSPGNYVAPRMSGGGMSDIPLPLILFGAAAIGGIVLLTRKKKG